MIIKMYVTLMPVIFAGILNMIFTKTKLYKIHRQPMDKNKLLKDGKRLFGDNKTWIGFCSMTLFGLSMQMLWGVLCNNITFLGDNNYLYLNHSNTILYNGIVGFLLGLSYMVFEIPNSFIKRRINITPGKTTKGIIGILFFIIDQIDSLFGVALILSLFYEMTLFQYFMYIIVGGVTHILVNLILYKLKIRRNI